MIVKEFVIVIVNDGLIQGGEEVVCIVSDQRLRLVRQGNLGVRAAMKSRVAASKEEHIPFLDADNLWKPRFRETTINLWKKYS